MMRSVVFTGPFTDADLAGMVDLLRAIDARRPYETFTMVIEDSERTTGEAFEVLRQIMPKRPDRVTILEFPWDVPVPKPERKPS